MNFQQLETFLWVARLGSVTQACERLNVTQSALSMRLKALEAELQVPLFDRSKKRMKLTAKGRALVTYAEKIVSTVKEVQLYVADPAAQTGTLRVGCSELVALTWGPTLLHEISVRFPQVVINQDVGLPADLNAKIRSGEVDVALGAVEKEVTGPFPSWPLGDVSYSWYASPSLGIPDGPVGPRELEKFAIVGATQSKSVLYWKTQEWFRRNGASVQRYCVCSSLTANMSMVIQGLGISLLPDIYCEPMRADGSAVRLQTEMRVGMHYVALASALGDQVLEHQIAEIAQSISTFDRSSIPENGGAARDAATR